MISQRNHAKAISSVFLASLKPEARISQFPSFIPQVWHLSIQGPNPILQPRELLHSGCNIESFPSPFFRGEAIVMTTRHLFIYHCKLVYVWDGTLGSHDMSGPMSIASKSVTFSEPDHTCLGTRNMRSNSVHGRFPLSDSPLVFEFSLTGPTSLTQTRGRDKTIFHHLPTKLPYFPYPI
jgi:hypothetical protein